MGARRNAAVYAGLVGSMALLAPAPASALSLRDVAEALDATFGTPSLAFVAGIAYGAAVMGGVSLTAAAVARHRRRRREERAAQSVAPEATSSRPPFRDEPVEDAPAAAEPPRRAKHFRVQAPEAEVTVEPVEKVFAEPAATERGERGGRPRAAQKAEATGPAAQEGPRPASHAATDYADIAENYVRRVSFRERMARRAQGVAETLRQRMDAGKMDGVPVIARADGSVGDVGTSWWEASVGSDSIISDSGFAEERDLAIPADFTGADLASAPLAAFPAPSAARLDVPLVPAPAQGAGLSGRVPFVDEGVYPEHRTMDDLSSGDDWASALRSLDERLAADAGAGDPVPFEDSVGGIDTLDEPDNLEPATSFIPFRTPAGHPEVVDTETYVDYLINEEFSKNSSKAVRRTSRRFLRVLEGGTQANQRHLSDSTGVGYVGKHFSSPRAAEA